MIRSGGWRDVPGDPGLVPTSHRNERGPYVGTPRAGSIRRFARDPRLDRLLVELYRGFGPQRWWPAETPFEVVVGAVLTQNTAWRNVELALEELKRRGELTPASLLGLGNGELGRRIRSSGYWRLKAERLRAISRWYLEAGGLVALTARPLEPVRHELLEVRGVGPETADSILCYAAGRRTAVVDAYARRVLSRHDLVDERTPYEELRSWLTERLVASQSVFEEAHALFVRVGYDHCRPSPRCETCPATTPPGQARGPSSGRGGRGTGAGRKKSARGEQERRSAGR